MVASKDAARREHERERLLLRQQRKETFRVACARAQSLGFSLRQAPFAAMAFLTLTALDGPPPTLTLVRQRVRSQYPWLWEETGEIQQEGGT